MEGGTVYTPYAFKEARKGMRMNLSWRQNKCSVLLSKDKISAQSFCADPALELRTEGGDRKVPASRADL